MHAYTSTIRDGEEEAYDSQIVGPPSAAGQGVSSVFSPEKGWPARPEEHPRRAGKNEKMKLKMLEK